MQRRPAANVHRGCATALAFAAFAASPQAHADYPIVSHRYLADPGSLVFDGRIYLYNSNDDDNAVGGGYTMHSIVCISTDDLKNWTDHGIVFSVPTNASWATNSWAPQPIVRDGTIFLYFGNSGNGVGVASSKDPTGGFKDAKGGYLVNSSTPGASGTNSWLFDPGALIDDDGQAYLSFGGNGENNARIIKLGSDLASVSGTATQLSPKAFFEASFLFKRSSTYYFAYSSNPSNGTRIDYLTSSSPMSGYTYAGTIADGPPENGDNNHASQFEFKGQWYHAYHNRIVARQAGIAATYKRNLAIEVLNFNADGTIKKVTYTTDGVPQVGNLNPYVRVEAETTNAQSGIETDVCSEGGMDVTSISNGDWIRVRGLDFGNAGAESFMARVASAGSGGSIELRLGSETGTLIGTCTVTTSGGAQKWADSTCSVTGATGVKDLYLKFTGSGTSDLFNLNYWQFTPKGGVIVGAGGSAGSANSGGVSSAGGPSSGGGTSSVGGTSPNGGTTSTGGSGTNSAGGISNAGGARTGGTASSIGGVSPNGGTLTMGGSGTNPTGGASNTGGARTGGAASSGEGGAVANSLGGTSSLATTGGVSSNGGRSTGGNVSIGGGQVVSTSTPGTPTDEGGCSCRVAKRGDSSPSLWSIAMLGVVLAAHRRRRSGKN